MRTTTIVRRAALALAALACLSTASFAQDALLERARRAVEAGQVAGIRDELARHASANPKDARAAYWLGRVYLVERDWEKGADALERAVALDPAHAPSHYWLGGAYGEQAQRASKLRQPFLAKKVLREFRRAVELDPDYLDARAGLVDFYRVAPGFMGGGMDKARAEAAEIRRRDPLRGAYAYALVAMQERKPDVAATEYETAIGLAPDSARPYILLADLHARRERWDDAWATIERFRARRPADPRGGFYVGRTAALSGQRLDDGEQGLRQYLRHTPGAGEPSLAAAHWRLGQILERRGDRAAARGEYEQALRLDPRLEGARQSLKKLGA